jgi:hypothetical protein
LLYLALSYNKLAIFMASSLYIIAIRYLRVILFIGFSVFGNTTHAQAPGVQWQRSLGGTAIDEGYSIIYTADGGYAVAGLASSNNGDVTGNHGLDDVWVVKLSATGNIEWQKTFGGTSYDMAYSIVQTFDGGYAVGGATRSVNGDVSSNHGADDFWIIKLSATGDLEWQKTLGGTSYDVAYDLIQTTDSGYAMTGYTYSNDGDVSGQHGSGYTDYWVVKLSSAGSIEWQKTLGGTDHDQPLSIIQSMDGGYIVVGETASGNGDVTGWHGGEDYWVVKLSSAGSLQWQITLGGSFLDNAYGVVQATDSGYVIMGQTNSIDGDVVGNHGSADIWVVKLSITGSIVWKKTLGGIGAENAGDLINTTDGGYAIIANAQTVNGDVSGTHGSQDFWLVKLSAMGDLQWQKALGGTLTDFGRSVTQNANGGYALTGLSNSNNGDVSGHHGTGSPYDMWVVMVNHTITTDSLASTFLCPGTALTVNFTSIGSFDSSNIYTAQLSDATGNFTSPVSIGTWAGNANSGSINAVIPGSTAAGTSYRIRVISSAPPVTGSDNGSDITIGLPSSGTVSQTICQGQSFEGYMATGVYLDTLTNANGCDSIRTLNLTVSAPMVANDTMSICQGEVFNGYTITGIYSDTFSTANGCDSIYILHLTVEQIPAIPDISATNNELSIPDTFYTYQWYRNDTLLNGQNTHTFIAPMNGNYTVAVTNEAGCADTSAVFHLMGVGIGSGAIPRSIQYYPNPTNGPVNLHLNGATNATWTLYNSLGQLLQKGVFNNDAMIDLSNYSDGIYYFKVEVEGEVVIEKVQLLK